ncbi:hypothetical protein DEO72_LG4g161 [Vigna unguiculata]|uniref:Uncharacterized protein n=1 Tax=Vigna unguiculata TaxID=3917 RepID=A0A4D6LL31_VIGUN|nr:hypothetical protein DEO72_LG4g161 [Vigna unguiculata]
MEPHFPGLGNDHHLGLVKMKILVLTTPLHRKKSSLLCACRAKKSHWRELVTTLQEEPPATACGDGGPGAMGRRRRGGHGGGRFVERRKGWVAGGCRASHGGGGWLEQQKEIFSALCLSSEEEPLARACHDLARRTTGDGLWRRWPWCDGTASKRRPWWRQICRAKKRVGGWWVQSFAWWWWVAGAAGYREKERKRRGQPPWKPPRHLQRTITTANLHGSHRVTLNAVWTCNRTRARFERSSTPACTRVRDHHHAIRAAARDADGEGGRKGK